MVVARWQRGHKGSGSKCGKEGDQEEDVVAAVKVTTRWWQHRQEGC